MLVLFLYVPIQAENAIDRMDWMDKITGVIASLLNNQIPEQVREIYQLFIRPQT